jgi:hypothetical protein
MPTKEKASRLIVAVVVARDPPIFQRFFSFLPEAGWNFKINYTLPEACIAAARARVLRSKYCHAQGKSLLISTLVGGPAGYVPYLQKGGVSSGVSDTIRSRYVILVDCLLENMFSKTISNYSWYFSFDSLYMYTST